MTYDQQQPDPTFLPASLVASSVGTWDYDILSDHVRYCSAMAELFGLSPEQGNAGVPLDRIAAVIHPDDRARGRAKRGHMLQQGGAFVIEYRVVSSPQVTRWVLVRGFYEPDSEGRIVRGRGIVVDVTECKEEGFAEGEVFFMSEADDKEVTALDRAGRHVMAARRSLDEVNAVGIPYLQSAADALLLDIARHIAGTLIPVMPSRTEH